MFRSYSLSTAFFFATISAIYAFNGAFLIETSTNVNAPVITNNKIIAHIITPFRDRNVSVRAYYVNLMHYYIQLLMNYEIN